ncbi:hypothetical protein LCGC14_1618500 [marine sediment metagenome]|uniref:Sulfotransferase domain-containing protein n=1 Tax=marine sediment metagenome TaxID=412755 RepID=A0A0F9KLU0_9ZZZZ
MTYKIFGIGLSRTGTTSLAYALKEIGINIVHYPMSEAQLFDPENDGACDIPVITYYKELDKKFPNSKFIYTFREKEEWLNSMAVYLPRKKDWPKSAWQTQHRMAVYEREDFDRDAFAKRYDLHDTDVREYFKGREQDLLILNICEGDTTEKLFSFIGVFNENAPKTFSNKNKLRIKQ